MNLRRILVEPNPFPLHDGRQYEEKLQLDSCWISAGGLKPNEPVVMEFMLDFELPQATRFRIHASADQQYRLWVDRVLVGRGCEQKSPENWYFESYEFTLQKGRHTVSALVWNYGTLSPMNRMSLYPGFILIPDPQHMKLLGTGIAPWRVRRIKNRRFAPLPEVPGGWISVAPDEITDLRITKSGGWLVPTVMEPGVNGFLSKSGDTHCLTPSPLREVCHDEIIPGGDFIFDSYDNGRVPEKPEKFNGCNRFPPGSEKRIIFDLGNYFCAFSKLRFRGGEGAKIRITWAEAAFEDPEKPMKGNRNLIAGKYFRGVWDEVILDGKTREWTPLAWRCGRFIELHIVTSGEALELERFSLEETGYPLKMDGGFSCNDDKVNEIIPFCFRTLQMSAHDNFVDCPFYEQLLYAGDGRLESLVNLVAAKDDTLVKKAIETLACSRDINGLTMARWPSRRRQYIPSFSLWWIGMLYDYALWRDNKTFVEANLPTMRTLLENFMGRCDEEGFLRGVTWEWNFIDWVDDWYNTGNAGTPPGVENARNATYNWLFVHVLGMAEKLEWYAGNEYMARRWRSTAQNLSKKLSAKLWCAEEGLFSESDSGNCFSRHAQILAILSNSLEPTQMERLKQSSIGAGLSECSIFFRHYLFEAFTMLRLPEQILDGLNLWNKFIDNGFKTVPETPENRTFNQRSDCHGWGAHPIYHLIANIAGIKPADMGFKKVLIEPQPGHLEHIEAQCVHPRGMIKLDLQKKEGFLSAKITLPPEVTGRFIYHEHIVMLDQSENNFEIIDSSSTCEI